MLARAPAGHGAFDRVGQEVHLPHLGGIAVPQAGRRVVGWQPRCPGRPSGGVTGPALPRPVPREPRRDSHARQGPQGQEPPPGRRLAERQRPVVRAQPALRQAERRDQQPGGGHAALFRPVPVPNGFRGDGLESAVAADPA